MKELRHTSPVQRTLRRVADRARLAMAAGVGCALFAACAALGPAPARGPAQLSVEVLRGFSFPRAPLRELPNDLHVLVDASPGLATPSDGRPAAWLAARGGARELVSALPARVPVHLHVLGDDDTSEACAGARVRASGTDREALRTALDEIEPRGGGSLVASLDALAAELGPKQAAGARVVVFSDVADACGADPCAVAARLVASGAWIDWVVLGEAEPPACLASLEPPPAIPGPVASALAQQTARFDVLRADTDTPFASGQSGDVLSLEPGTFRIRIDLDPPEQIGPFQVAAGEHARLRVLDFPLGDPPRRVWQIEGDQRFDPTLPEPMEFDTDE